MWASWHRWACVGDKFPLTPKHYLDHTSGRYSAQMCGIDANYDASCAQRTCFCAIMSHIMIFCNRWLMEPLICVITSHLLDTITWDDPLLGPSEHLLGCWSSWCMASITVINTYNKMVFGRHCKIITPRSTQVTDTDLKGLFKMGKQVGPHI